MINNLLKKLKSHHSLAVFSHTRPDGDAIGSQVAFCLWCKKNEIEVRGFNDDDIQENIRWLTEFFPIEKPDKDFLDACDAYVFLDGNSPERFGQYSDYFRASSKPFYLIDHHPDPEDFFEEAYSDPKASSTAELVYHLFLIDDITLIDSPVAQALYTGLMTDTGSFRFDSVAPETHTILSDLIRRGKFQPHLLHERVYDNRTLNQLHLLGLALERIELHHNNQIGILTVTEDMLEQTGCSYSDLEGFVSYPLSIKGVKAAVLFCELEGKIKLSMRSKRDLDVNLLAREFAGGGHKKAAGAWHSGPMDKAVEDVVRAAAGQMIHNEP